MNKYDWFGLLLGETEKKFDRGTSFYWQNKDFDDLSDQIMKKINVYISKSTLKRIFGSISRSESYFPQQATIKALIDYSGFQIKLPRLEGDSAQNYWSYFKSLKYKFAESLDVFSRFRFLLIFALGVFLAIGFYLFSNSHIIDPKFKLIEIDGKYNFLSATYQFDIENMNDSVWIISSVPIRREVFVPKKLKTINVFYHNPGAYPTYLKTRNRVISDTHCIVVESKGWNTFARYFEPQKFDRAAYFDLKLAVRQKIFHVSKNELSLMGIDTNRYTLVFLNNYRRTNQNGDDFVFDAHIKNNIQWTAQLCNAVEIFLCGDKGSIKFKIINNGCGTFAYAELSEKKFDGLTTNLSSLSNDLEDFKHIKIINNHKNVTFLLEGKVIYKNNYNNSIGNLVGLSIVFHGNGYAKSIRLQKNQNTAPLFEF